MAAHAAELSGWEVTIFSRKQKSPLYGAQYLHQPIPGLECGDPKMVRYALFGTPEMYRRKVYGTTWDGTVSPEDFMESHSAWDLRAAYDHMWSEYQEQIIDCDLGPRWATNPRQFFGGKFDLIISTVPRTTWDDNWCNFERTYIWALGDTEIPRVNWHRPDPYTVICNGYTDVQWYRISNIFGYCTMEWPRWWNAPYASVTPPVPGASLVAKPLEYTGNAAPDFIHLGRYAQWTKGVLTSDVFYNAMKVFASDKIG